MSSAHLLLGALRLILSCAARSAQWAQASSAMMLAHVTGQLPRPHMHASHRATHKVTCALQLLCGLVTAFSWTTVGYTASFQIHAHTQTYIYTQTSIHMYKHTQIHTHTHTQMHAYIHDMLMGRRETPGRVLPQMRRLLELLSGLTLSLSY